MRYASLICVWFDDQLYCVIYAVLTKCLISSCLCCLFLSVHLFVVLKNPTMLSRAVCATALLVTLGVANVAAQAVEAEEAEVGQLHCTWEHITFDPMRT